MPVEVAMVKRHQLGIMRMSIAPTRDVPTKGQHDIQPVPGANKRWNNTIMLKKWDDEMTVEEEEA